MGLVSASKHCLEAGERQGDTANHRRAHDSRVWVKGERGKGKGVECKV